MAAANRSPREAVRHRLGEAPPGQTQSARPHEYETRRRKTSAGNYKDWVHTPITWHDLRHAFGTFLAANGFQAPTIEEWCGWADAKTMKRYLHYRPGGTELEALNAAIRRDRERNVQDRPPTVDAVVGAAKLSG